MKRVTLPSLWLLVLLAVPLSACFEPKSITCSSGLVCPQNQACSDDGTQCIQTACGDGKIQAGEACDDGNVRPGDGCSADCKSDESCGNHTVDTGEVCDDGNTASGDGCSADCKSSEKCGDGVIDKEAGEVCDDGNTKDKDRCSANCRSDESCGNGFVDRIVGEVCDDGNTVSGDKCSSDCRSGEGCGNGIRDATEECDDGNPDDTDGCLNDCHLARCGDGFVNVAGGEECDPKNAPGSCNSDCTLSTCGDGKVNPAAGEQCDNLGAVNSSTCTSQCQVSFCGDGFHNPAAGEQCDDGNSDDNDACLNNCKLNVCGDSHKSPTEACDLGTANGATACDYGVTSCKLCNSNCTAETTGTGAYCGDGVPNGPPGTEACDDGNNITETECPYGPTMNCNLCSKDCKTPKNNSPARYCGNRTVDASDEQCDDGNPLSCGTCDATCKVPQALAAAVGRIVVMKINGLGGKIFRIYDGVQFAVFEFDTNGSVAAGHIPIDVSGNANRDVVADRIKDAINSSAAALAITAEVLQDDVTYAVTLTHDNPGSQGTQPIYDTVSNTSLVQFTGMSGGFGRDCPADTGCKLDDDCAPGLTCSGSTHKCE